MKTLLNKTIIAITALQGMNQLITLDDGSQVIVKVIALPEDLENLGTSKEEKSAPAKSEKPAPAKSEGKSKKMTFTDLEDMDREELEDLVDDKDLDIKLKDFKNDDDGLRKAIAEELDIEIPDDDTEEEEEEEEEEEDKLDWDDLEKMDRDEMEDLIDDEKLDVDADDFKKDKDLRLAIAKEMGIKPPKK